MSNDMVRAPARSYGRPMNGHLNYLVANERAADMRRTAAEHHIANEFRTARPVPKRPAPKRSTAVRLRLRRPLKTA